MELEQVALYRITHIENVSHILQCGITHKNSPNRNPNFRNIGDVSLIDTRSKKTVCVDNGELASGGIEITLGDYTPFYFGVKMPMLYVAQNGGNFVEKATSSGDIVYLICYLKSIISSGNTFYFTDGHATDNYTTFYDRSRLDKLVKIVDWNAVKSQYWGGVENLNVKRKKQAELLVHGDIAPEHIIGFGCSNEKAKNRLLSIGVSASTIKINPNAYY